jgi:hypothetical protein
MRRFGESSQSALLLLLLWLLVVFRLLSIGIAQGKNHESWVGPALNFGRSFRMLTFNLLNPPEAGSEDNLGNSKYAWRTWQKLYPG